MKYEKYEKLRNAAGYKTNAEVAKLTGIAPATFTEWKQGKYEPKTDKLDKIRRLFGCSMIDFYNENLIEGLEAQQLSTMRSLNLLERIKEDIGDLSQEAIDVARKWQNADEETQRMIVEMLAFFESKKKS